MFKKIMATSMFSIKSFEWYNKTSSGSTGGGGGGQGVIKRWPPSAAAYIYFMLLALPLPTKFLKTQ